MLYLAIDQHRKQLTVNLRNEAGDVLVKRQVSTQWPRVREFLAEVQKQALPEEGFVVILEVCGFNDWLLKLLVEYGCRETILIQPEKQSKKKTDRRDANTLGEILWVNRQRLLAGKTVQGIRHVQPASEQDAADRQIHEGMDRGAAAMKRTAQTTSLNKTVTTMFPNWKPNLTATKPKTALPWSVRKKIRQGTLDTKSSFRNDTPA